MTIPEITQKISALRDEIRALENQRAQIESDEIAAKYGVKIGEKVRLTSYSKEVDGVLCSFFSQRIARLKILKKDGTPSKAEREFYFYDIKPL